MAAPQGAGAGGHNSRNRNKLDRWQGISRPYSTKEVEKLRGSLHVEHTLARRGAGKLWELLHEED